jgi:integrase
VGKLTTKTTKTATAIKDLPIGKHGDGEGLWLVITAPDKGKWVYRYQRTYVARQMGLGPYPRISLTKAREAALKAYLLIRDGIDPLDEKRKAKVAIPTFGEFAKSVIEAQTVGVSAKHAASWGASLSTYASALLDRPVNSISIEDVLGVLKPIWSSKPETADRVRNRIERILDAATARKFRTGTNPAAWRGNLDHLLGKRQRSGAHHAALAYSAVPAFVAKLSERGDVQARAIEFIILNAVRLSEAVGATWDEFDLDAKLWVIPADRMKAGKEHRVPLSDRAVEILCEMENVQDVEHGDRVFNISVRAIQNLVATMDKKATTHGMRSAFRDWCGDVAHAPREIAEEALAHAVGNQTERAYRRGDALEQRRQLMAAWAAYVQGAAGANVVDLASRRA